MRKYIEEIKSRKNQTPLVCLTAYSASIAAMADKHCDLILVGDSLAMVLYGEDSTQNASIEMMVRHGRAVVKASEHAVIVVDMPYGSYEHDPEGALKNAQTIMDETGAQAVKLEGGAKMAETIKLLTNNDIPVMGHIGLLPQSVNSPDGFKVQGKSLEQAEQLIKDAMAVEQAGAFCFVIEAVPEPLAAAITASGNIPSIGIGASAACDGQILVTEDMLGLSVGRKPKFVKAYADLSVNIDHALSSYAKDVKTRIFPAEENTYKASSKDKNAA
jgi:3-methyl-2-oxobutanoate hydroxymethyltransferase